MIIFGHNASLNLLDGNRIFDPNSSNWGPLIAKAEFLSQFSTIKAWEIYILPYQLRPQALEQLAGAMNLLAKHPLFQQLDWLSFHFPTSPQSHLQSPEISQENWRPFGQLLQVLNSFTAAKYKNLNFHLMAQATLAQAWKLDREQRIEDHIQKCQEFAKNEVAQALKIRDQINPDLGLTVENNPPYHNKAHAFHLSGMFPAEIKSWQTLGVDCCLDVQHASLTQWYRDRYGFDGPIPPLNVLKHRCSIESFLELGPRYIHATGAPNTPESFHQGVPIATETDDVNWIAWASGLKSLAENSATKYDLPVIIELEQGHLPEFWPDCQTSMEYLRNLTQ